MNHGGDLGQAKEQFGDADWLDLSTGINPRSYSKLEVHEGSWRALPQSDRLNDLLNAAHRYYAVTDGSELVAAHGSQAIIQTMARLARAGTSVAVLGPTYSEHTSQWVNAGHQVRAITTLGTPEAETADVLIVTNPNNPDGRIVPPARLRALCRQRGLTGRSTIVDEAFADVCPGSSLVPDLPAGTTVLRSIGKFFGLAGLRLGFAIGESTEMVALAKALGPWAVSGPALEIGSRALRDDQWVESTLHWLTAQTANFSNILAVHGLESIGGTTLFTLITHPRCAMLHQALAGQGILTRRFDEHPQWLRFGLPGNDDALERVARAIASFNLSGSDAR